MCILGNVLPHKFGGRNQGIGLVWDIFIDPFIDSLLNRKDKPVFARIAETNTGQVLHGSYCFALIQHRLLDHGKVYQVGFEAIELSFEP